MKHDKAKPGTINVDQEIYELGESFVCHFTRLLQLARIHGPGNRLTLDAANQVIATGRKLLDENDEGLTIEARHGRFFIQGEKLLLRKKSAVFVFSLLGWFERLGLHGLRFNQGLCSVTPETAYQLVYEMMEARNQSRPAQWLGNRLEQERFFWVDTISGPRTGAGSSDSERAEVAHRLYSYAYNALKEVARKIIEEKASGLRKPLRVIQDITDLA
ncbi:MAG: hypothetical protein ACOC7W_07185, partial [Desulfosalsimonas sp.]